MRPRRLRTLVAGVGCAFAIGGFIALLRAQERGGEWEREQEAESIRPERSVFIPNPLETHVLGQTNWLPGSEAGLRIIVFDHNTNRPIRNAAVRLELMDADQRDQREQRDHSEQRLAASLFRGATNERGTVDANFRVPNLPPKSYELSITVAAPIGTDRVTQTVNLQESAQILLTTDKPLYQPNQLIHMRTLCLSRPDLKPVASRRCIFEVEDPKGNKVFKKTVPTSRFGIASADFQLADEINLGRYTVRAALKTDEGGGARNESTIATAEKKVTVDRYVLPKFKVRLETDKRFYLPGETLKGAVQADYFFGKPVAEGEVLIKLATFDVKWNDFAEVKGTTNPNGSWKFEQQLPAFFAGLPLEQGNALVKLEVTVTDKAEHQERITQTLPVAKDPIKITVVPESARLAPKVENTLFVLTSYPDGTPAKTRFILTGSWSAASADEGISGETNELGIGEVRITPAAANLQLTVSARDAQGNQGRKSQTLQSGSEESLLLRTNKSIAEVGETLRIEVITSRPGGTVYVDVIKDKQTVLTRSAYLTKGRTTLSLPLDETLAGTILVHAYRITKDGQMLRDTKLCYVNPASDLKLLVKPDRETYQPGKLANLEFNVTDLNGHPVLAALGISIVDESVFALEEMQPGLEKIYFTLEKELLQPRYEIHGFGPEQVIPMPVAMREERGAILAERERLKLDVSKQKAARVLFAAAAPMVEFGINVNTYQQKAAKVRQAWQEHVSKAADKVFKALQQYRKRFGDYPDPDDALGELVRTKLLLPGDTKDPMGNSYQIKVRNNNKQQFRYTLTLISAGLDGRMGTGDDVRGLGGALRFRQELRALAPGILAEGEVFEAAPMAGGAGGVAAAAVKASKEGVEVAKHAAPGAEPTEPVRIRQFFPETLFFAPQVITDERGRATVDVTMADSITTWRLTALGNSAAGQLGSTTAPLRVFQDFFIDLDLPVSLTQNDEVAIPVAIYNYLPQTQTLRLKLTKDDWFTPLDEAEKEVRMNSGDVGVAYFRLRVKKIGSHSLTVHAYGSKMSDAIKRSIEVMPDGKEVWQTFNDRLEGDVEKTVTIPAEAIDGASNILVKVYPGAFSQVVEGLDKLLRMPFGCFEQTSSVTYPNILVTDYLKRTKKINPEIQMKAEQYINLGYQRLLTFEVKGGGFSWFGNAPAHKLLTAYGLMQFNDMSKVHEVDVALIRRTADWLVAQQKEDGHWERDEGGIAEGVINRQTDLLRVTAYIAWALTEASGAGQGSAGNIANALNRAVQYVTPKMDSVEDAYALAVICNMLGGWNREHEATRRAMNRLAEMAVEEEKVAYWKTKDPTPFYGRPNDTADLETTALAAYALLKGGSHPALITKALTYLVQKKDAFGTWQTTQATVWALKALLLAMEKGTTETQALVAVRINGREAAQFEITPENSDVLRQVDLKPFVKEGANRLAISFKGKGAPLYQISAKYYLPWALEGEEVEPLDIDVDYDRTELSVNETVTCRVRVTNNQRLTANMVIVDLGIPPGFEVQSGDLAELVGSKAIQKFSLTGRQIIIYLEKVEPGKPLVFSYRLKAKYPIRAKTGKSVAYEYYAPQVAGVQRPRELVVR